MNYEDAVIEAKGLIQRRKEARNQLIDLTAEVLSMPGITQTKWAQDIGVHVSTVQDWVRFIRDVSNTAAAGSYDDWYMENRRNETDRAVSAARNLPVTDKAELVREALAEPEVAKEVLSDPDTARNVAAAAPGQVGRALAEHHEEVERQVKRGPNREVRDSMQARIEVLTALQRMAEAKKAIFSLTELASHLRSDEMDMLRAGGDELALAVEWVRSLNPDTVSVGNTVPESWTA